jgi:hypothetical protein
MKCPKCHSECSRDEVDNGVDTMYGPYGCFNCGWSDNSEYDISEGKKEIDGYLIDSCGGGIKLKGETK